MAGFVSPGKSRAVVSNSGGAVEIDSGPERFRATPWVLLLSADNGRTGRRAALSLAHHHCEAGDSTLFVTIGASSPEAQTKATQSPHEPLLKKIDLPMPEISDMGLTNRLKPELPTSEAVILYAAQMAPACLRALPDGTQTLLVVRWRKTSRARVGQVLALLENLGVSPVGVVLTEVDIRIAPEDLL